MFRSIAATLDCRRCGVAFGDLLQFKTDDGDGLEEYVGGDVALDITPGTYDGFANAFCPACALLHIVDENAESFALLADAVEAGLELWPACSRYDHGARAVVTRTTASPLGAHDVRAAAAKPQTDRHNLNYNAFWAAHDVVDDGERISMGAWPVRSTWREDHRDAVDARLLERGWPSGANRNLDVPVVVDADHVLHVEVSRARPAE